MKRLAGFSLFLLAGLVLCASTSQAQLIVNVNTKIKSCDDFASQQLNDPWDMLNAEDVNNFTPSDITSITPQSFLNGVFSFAVTANNAGAFYLFSPQLCGSDPIGGRWGQNLNVSTSKYSTFSVRMCTPTIDPAGFRLIWNRSCDYVPSRTVTSAQPIKTGCNVYRVDLNSIGISGSDSSNVSPWSSGSITGFALQPTQIAQNVQIDYIKLEDPSSCGSTAVSYTATTSGNDDLFSLYIDDDSNPSNGFFTQLVTAGSAAGAGSATASALGLFPGNYKAVGILHSDYALLERTDPWDMSQDTDISLLAGITSSGFSNGTFSGVTSTTGPLIYLKIGDGNIDASKYDKLSLQLSRNITSAFNLFWTPVGSGPTGMTIDPAVADSNNDGIFEIDLNGVAGWSGTIRELIIQPAIQAGVTFSIDFVSLRSSGFVSSLPDPANSYVASTGNLTVNAPPLFRIDEPNLKGGVALRSWNMNNPDIVLQENLRSDADPAHSGEALTCFLPDVRTVDGVRGDFYKGTNIAGNDDPINYSTFPFFNASPLTFDAGQFKNLCFKLNVDREFDLCLGSVGRVVHKNQGSADTDFIVSDDIVLIYNRWSTSKWYEYCLDMTTLRTEPSGVPNWAGIQEAFRVDAHEFHRDTCGPNGVPTGNPISATYYFDFIKLRQDDGSSSGQYAIVYDLADADDVASVSFFASTQPGGTSNDIAIGSVDETRNSNVLIWNTAGVPAGTYFIYGIASDGLNSTGRFATGKAVIGSGSPAVAPVLNVERPASGEAICDGMQVKGYALQQDRLEDVASVEVLVDDQLLQVIHPSLYSGVAKSAFPTADSSNSGFDTTVAVSSLPAGAHTVTIKAFSSDGATTSQSISVTKQASGCPAPNTDPNPAGSPVTPDGPLPTPTVVPAEPPIITKATFNKKGRLDLTIGQIGSAACSLTVRLGANTSDTFTDLKTFAVEAADISTGVKKLQATNLKIKKSKLSSFALQINKTCTGQSTVSSAARSVKVTTKKGSISSINALRNALRSKLAKAKKARRTRGR